MTPIADMVEQLLQERVPHTAIVAAVRAAELSRALSRDSHADTRREADRLRKRRSREKQRKNLDKLEANDASKFSKHGPTESRDSHADTADKRCDLLSVSSSEVATNEERKKQLHAREARGCPRTRRSAPRVVNTPSKAGSRTPTVCGPNSSTTGRGFQAPAV